MQKNRHILICNCLVSY